MSAARALWAHIRENCAPYAALELDELGKEKESLAVQPGQGDARSAAYLDGVCVALAPFTLYAKSDSAERARGWLDGAVRHFTPGVEIELDGWRGRACAAGTPHLRDRTAQGGYIYAAEFAVEYDERGDGG